jgi:hypothetical protein
MCVADIYKSVVLKMSDAEYSRILDAASAGGETVESYLTQCCVREAHGEMDGRPYQFAGMSFRTSELPDGWYETFSEKSLIFHLTKALRRGNVAAAYAMAIELLDFPDDWHDLECNVKILSELRSAGSVPHAELASLFNAVAGCVALPASANTWECCSALLKMACGRFQGNHSPPRQATS